MFIFLLTAENVVIIGVAICPHATCCILSDGELFFFFLKKMNSFYPVRETENEDKRRCRNYSQLGFGPSICLSCLKIEVRYF